MFDNESLAGPLIWRSLATRNAELDRLRDAGVTDFDAAIMPIEEGADDRAIAFSCRPGCRSQRV